MTAQASISFDAEYARVVKAVETAQARGDDFEQVVNACMAALARASITNDAPLDQLVARLAGERDGAQQKAAALEAWRDQPERARKITQLVETIVRLEAQARVSSDHAAALQAQLEETQRERDEACARVAVLERKIDHYLAERDISDLMHDAQIQERDAARLELATLRTAHTATTALGGQP